VSNKRKRRRPSGSRPHKEEGALAPSGSGGGRRPRPDVARGSGRESARSQARNGRSTGAKAAGAKAAGAKAAGRGAATELTPHPPLGVSLARGLAAVGGSLPLLVTSFLAALGLWVIYSSYGTLVAPSPAAMVLLESLPPLHSFLDLQLVVSGRDISFVLATTFMVGLIVLRAAIQSLWIGLTLESLRGKRGWRSSFLPGLRRGIRGFRTMVAVEATFMLLAVASVFLGPALGQLAVIGVLVGGTYFLALAPVIAIGERDAFRPTLRLAIKSARIPGPRHTLLALSYLAAALLISYITPGAGAAAATPSVTTWAFTLFVSFLHVGCLGAFTYRWLAVRQSILPLVGAQGAIAS
jgi:hypothetical protein